MLISIKMVEDVNCKYCAKGSEPEIVGDLKLITCGVRATPANGDDSGAVGCPYFPRYDTRGASR